MGFTVRFEAEDYPRKRFVVRVWKTCKGRLKLEKELEFDDFFDASDAYFKIELDKIMVKMDTMNMSDEQKYYAVSKVWYDTMYQVAGDIENKVLEENEFISYIPECPEMHGIRAKHSYEFVENKEEFQRYLELFYQECDKAGIAWEWNREIYSDAREACKKAENELIDWFNNQIEMSETKGMMAEDHREATDRLMKHWKYREQLIDIAMKWKPVKTEQQED